MPKRSCCMQQKNKEGQRLEFFVPEEMYDGFAQGQTGTLTLIDG